MLGYLLLLTFALPVLSILLPPDLSLQVSLRSHFTPDRKNYLCLTLQSAGICGKFDESFEIVHWVFNELVDSEIK